MTNAVVMTALLAPLLALDRRVRVVGPLLAAAAWAGLLIADADVSLGPLAPDRLGLATAAGTALLAARRPAGLTDDFDVPLVGAVLAAAAVWSTSTGLSPAPLVVTLGLAAFFALEGRAWRAPLLVGAAAVVAVVAIVLDQRTGSAALRPAGGLAAALPGGLAAAAVLVTVAGHRVGRAALVLPTALALGLRLVPGVIGTGIADAVTIGLVAMAAVVAAPPMLPRWAARRWPTSLAFDTGDGVCVGLIVLAVASVPAATPVAALLASGAVLCVAAGGPLAGVALVPGVAAVLSLLAGDGDVVGSITAVLVVAVLAALLATPHEVDALEGGEHDALVAPLLSAGACLWLLLAPRTWGWVGPVDLAAFDDGAGVAVAAGAAAAVLTLLQRLRSDPSGSGHVLARAVQPPVGQEPTIRSSPAPARARHDRQRERMRQQ